MEEQSELAIEQEEALIEAFAWEWDLATVSKDARDLLEELLKSGRSELTEYILNIESFETKTERGTVIYHLLVTGIGIDRHYFVGFCHGFKHCFSETTRMNT